MSHQLNLTRLGCLKTVAKEGELPSDALQAAHAEGKLIYDELVKLLNQSPIVIDEPFVPDYDGFVRPIGTDELQFHLPIEFRAHWPMKNQDHMVPAEQKVEDFNISYDGRIFWVTVQVDSPMSGWQSFSVGREGHRILQAILGKGERFTCEILGPYSMFVACYVAIADDTTTTYDFGRPLVRDHLNWESVVNVANADEHEAVVRGLWAPATTFYHLMEIREGMQSEIALLDDHFEQASEAYRTLVHETTISLPAWNRRRIARASLRSEIASAYASYASAEGSRAEIAEGLHSTREEFARHPSLQDCVDYPDETIRALTTWDAKHLVEGLRFLSEEARSNRLEAATVYAPLAGAAVGAAATALGILLTR